MQYAQMESSMNSDDSTREASSSNADGVAKTKRSFASRLFGYDLFISFALGAPPRGTQSYASDLARRLRERDYNVFFSEDEAPPGEQLDSTLRSALLRSRMLVVIANRGTLLAPRWVRREVEEFRKVYPNRAVVTINIGEALQDSVSAQSAREWLSYEGKIWIDEVEEAVTSGIVSDRVVARLATAPARARSNVRWRWIVRSVVVSLALLVLIAGTAAWIAERNANEANFQRIAAETSLANMVSTKARADLSKGFEHSASSLLAAMYAVHLARTAKTDSAFRELLYKTGGDVLTGHTHGVSGIAFSVDGRWLASVSLDRTLRIWDLDRSPRVGEILREDLGEFPRVAISDEGAWVAATKDDKVLLLQRSLASKAQWLSPNIGAIHTVFFATEKGVVFAVGTNGDVAQWRLDALSVPPKIISSPAQGDYTHAALSPNGRWLAVTGEPGLSLLDLDDSDSPLHLLQCAGRGVERLRFSTDGDVLAGLRFPDLNRTTVCTWSMDDLGAEPSQQDVALGLSPDLELVGGALLMLGVDGRIPIWFCLPPHCGQGVPLAVLGRDYLKQNCPENSSVDCGLWFSLAASRNGRWLAAAGFHETIRLFPTSSLDREPKLIPPRDELLPQGVLKRDDEWKPRPWSLSISPSGSVRDTPRGIEVRAAMVSRDASWVAWVENDRRIVGWSLSDPSMTRSWESRPNLASERDAFAVAVAPEKEVLATCTQRGELNVWQLTGSGAYTFRSLKLPRLTGLFAMALSHDVTRAAIADSSGAVRILDLNSGDVKELPPVPAAIGRPVGIILAPGGTSLYVNLETPVGGGALAVLDEREHGGRLQVIRQSESRFNDVAVSRDGEWIAASERSADVYAWHRSAGAGREFRLPGAGRWGSRIAFDPEGEALAITQKSSVLLWNFRHSRDALRLSLPDTRWSGGLQFTESGHSLVVGTKGGGVALWNLDLDELSAAACRTAGRDLTKTERQKFFGNVAFQQICEP